MPNLLGVFQKTITKSNQWIQELMEEIGIEDPHLLSRIPDTSLSSKSAIISKTLSPGLF